MEEIKTVGKRLETQTREQRLLGMDLLKIISMFMVVMLHVNGAGGILWNGTTFGTHWWIAHTLEHLCIVSVNAFAMVSGFLCFGRKWKIKNLISLWLQVFFYSVVITVIFMFGQGEIKATWEDLRLACFPVFMEQYWYFSAYFLMFFAIPIFNLAIERFSKVQVMCFLGVVGFLFTIGNSVNDSFHVGTGYNALWLGYMYCIGAFVKKYDFSFKIGKKELASWLYFFFYLTFVVIGVIRMAIFHKYLDEGPQYGYNFPLHFLGSVMLFLCFSRMKRKSNKVIATVSNATFGVFLIHVHDFTWACLSNAYRDFLKWNPWKMLIMMLLVGCSIYVTCTAIEIFRQSLFKWMQIPKLVNWLQKKIDGFFAKNEENGVPVSN